MIRQFGVIIFFLLLSFSVNSQSFTLELGAEKDNSIFSENTALSNGAGNNIFAGRIQDGSAFRRGLIKFDVSDLPSEAVIESVQLDLYVFRSARSTTTPHSFSVHKVLSEWGEAGSSGNGSGAAAHTGDATWSQRIYPNTDWTSSGGDFAAIASAAQMVSYSSFNLEKDVWSSAQMISDINSWRSNSNTNFGWILIGDETIYGSAKGFVSRDMTAPYDYARPKLTITYTFPSDNRVILNEVNPQKRRVELYNADSSSVDLSNYTLVSGTTTSTISGGNVSILNGNILLDSSEYIVLEWPDLNQNDGELALYNGDTISGELIDYIQYGSANQLHAAAAVSDSVWDNATLFLSTESDSSISYSLSTAQNYANGTKSNSTHWFSQHETPTYVNNPCLATLNLKGNLVEADYYSSSFIELEAVLSPTKDVLLSSSNAIHLKPGTSIELGNVFEAVIDGCWE